MPARRRKRRSPVHRGLRWLAAIGAALALAYLLFVLGRGRPQDTPWAALDLAQPIGLFTGRKLAALDAEPGQCRILLEKAGIRFQRFEQPAPPPCGIANGVRLVAGGARTTDYAPRDPATTCPVAAALALWEWEVVQPAARRHLRTSVSAIDQLGTYSCRRINGREDGAWSEHATANAIDIAGFRLADGRRLTLLGDWSPAGDEDDRREAAFLREVRDGACGLFATVLSPDYNAQHADHLHLDQADRGAMAWRACR